MKQPDAVLLCERHHSRNGPQNQGPSGSLYFQNVAGFQMQGRAHLFWDDSRLLCEIGRLDLPPSAMANGKHPHRLPPFFYFIDNPINVRLLTVKQMPQFSL
jgi:hypothetical protein